MPLPARTHLSIMLEVHDALRYLEQEGFIGMSLLGCNWFKTPFGGFVILRAVHMVPVRAGELRP
jgi:hypothetical protein